MSDLKVFIPLQVLQRYLDVLFYIANWGTTRLVFRLPHHLVNLEAMKQYFVEEHVEMHKAGAYVLLDITVDSEEGYGWTEEEGRLARLLLLREALLRGDHRLPYLAWLTALNSWEVDEAAVEPPIPAGLRDLTPPLRAFIEEFGLDPHLVMVAAASSPPMHAVHAENLRTAIAALSPEEQVGWLLRLAQGELNVEVAFRSKLLGNKDVAVPGQRTVAELLAAAQEERKRVKREEAARAEARRIQELEALAPKVEESWTFATQLIEQGRPGPYKEAVALLVKLHDLAVHEGRESEYKTRLRRLRERYPNRQALLRRIDNAGLP
ncbi:MAG TPA: hypothetical protein VE553_09445 [Candidatus Binatia bacterium]|nr:hypothetical protein [Candidatus Binatia bacterium]